MVIWIVLLLLLLLKKFLSLLDIDKYGHLDCLTATTAPEEIFKPSIEFLKE